MQNNQGKYRGFRLYNGEEVHGYYCQIQGHGIIILDNAKAIIQELGGLDIYPLGWVEVDPKSVEQFTGKRDEDGEGEEIYKGDLIHAANTDMVGVVIWDTLRAQWCIHVTGEGLTPLWKALGVAAGKIGTIHDNPKLMEANYENG